MTTIQLPAAGGDVEALDRPDDQPVFRAPQPFAARKLFAAPHVVANPRGNYVPGSNGSIDIEKTVEYRKFLWSYGLGVAEMMSTAERPAIAWDEMKRLIEATGSEAKKVGGEVICGIDSDQFDRTQPPTDIAGVTRAYREQLEFVESQGMRAVIRGSRHLARMATTAEDYASVYRAIIDNATSPVFIHWSGRVFVPEFAPYWGSEDTAVALESMLKIIEESDGKVAGLKISLLQPEVEKEVRRRLPSSCRVFTGDDYNFDELLMPDAEDGRYSDALLGILTSIAPLAAEAMALIDQGDDAAAGALLSRSIPLSKAIFEAPANRYASGVVFLAYLNGFQDHFRMIGGGEGNRPIEHYATVFKEAAAVGLIQDWDLAVSHFRPILETAGIAQKNAG